VRDLSGKLIAFVVGGALAVGAAVLGFQSLQDYRRFDDTARRSNLAGAVEASADGRRWVTVEGAAWRCDRLVRNIDGGVAFLPASGEDGSLVVARFDHAIRCAEVASGPLTGVIEPMSAERAADLRGAGLAVPDGASLRTLDVCAFCGKSNSRLGMLICWCLLFVGVAMYPLRVAFQAQHARALAALHGAIHAPPDQALHADRTVRVWGAALLVAAALAVTVGRGYVILGFLPLPWSGAFTGLLGLWMLGFPASYRRLAARRKPR